MFKQQYRFPAQKRLNQADTYNAESFLLKIAKNNLSYSRFGFIASKKIDKRAVKRNKAKRLLRTCLESLQPQIMAGYDMLFILRPIAKNQRMQSLKQEVVEKLLRARILNAK